MTYLFYYIWIGLAFLHPWMSKILIPINWVIIKIGNKSEKEQKEWRENYNEANLSFPGGIVDWFAFGLLLALIFIPIIILSVTFNLPLFSSKLYFGSFFVTITAFVYYWIYFKNLPWLKEKIEAVSKKYYF